MKQLLVTAAMLIGFSPLQAETINRHIAYYIPGTDLVTFSRSALTARLCDDCATERFSVDADTLFQERQSNIDLSRATELYLRRGQELIFIGVDREDNSIDYINFGGYASDEY